MQRLAKVAVFASLLPILASPFVLFFSVFAFDDPTAGATAYIVFFAINSYSLVLAGWAYLSWRLARNGRSGASLLMSAVPLGVAVWGLAALFDESWQYELDTFTSEEAEIIKWAKSGRVGRLASALEAGREINVVGTEGMNPLTAAYLSDEFETFVFLLKNGADPNIIAPSEYEFSTHFMDNPAAHILFWGSHRSLRSNLRYFRALIDHGLYCGLRNKHESLMHLAAQNPSEEYLQLLIPCGGDPNFATPTEGTPLARAARFGRWGNCLLLLDHDTVSDLDALARELAAAPESRRDQKWETVTAAVDAHRSRRISDQK